MRGNCRSESMGQGRHEGGEGGDWGMRSEGERGGAREARCGEGRGWAEARGCGEWRGEWRGWRGRHGGFGRRRAFVGFGGFMGGPSIRPSKMLGSEELQLIILSLLSEKPRHGYEIIKALEEHSSGIYVPSPGMVYPALTYLEEVGYTSSEAEGNKKLYKTTEAGAEYLKKNRATADESLEQLARVGRRIADFQKQYAADNETDDVGAAARHKDPDKRQQVLMNAALYRDLRHELRAALREKLDAKPEDRDRVVASIRKAIDEIRGKTGQNE